MTKHILTGVVGVLIAACGTTAEVRMKDGRVLEGVIAGADQRDLVFESGARVPRADIIDIDHPGNGAAITGGSLIVYGVLNGLLIEERIDEGEAEGEETFARVTGWSPLIVGLGLLPYGLIIWQGSRDAASGEGAPPATALVPMVGPDTAGAMWGGRF